MKYLLFKCLSGVLFILLSLFLYYIGNYLVIPCINRVNCLKILWLKKHIIGDIVLPALFFSTNYNYLSLFHLGIVPNIHAYNFIKYIKLCLKQFIYEDNDYINLIKYFPILFSIIYSYVITDNLDLYINSPKHLLFNNTQQKIVFTLTLFSGSTIFIWLIQKINLYKYRFGMNTILYIHIFSQLPEQLKELSWKYHNIKDFILPLCLWIVICFLIVFIENIYHKINIYDVQQYSSKNDFNLPTSLPLKFNNAAGATKLILSSNAFLLCLNLIELLLGLQHNYLQQVFLLNNGIVQTITIILFNIYYNHLTLNPIVISNNLNKYGGIIEGYRPGKDTANYLKRIIYPINILGSLYIIIIFLLSECFNQTFDLPFKLNVSYILIVLDTALEILNHMQVYFIPSKYDILLN